MSEPQDPSGDAPVEPQDRADVAEQSAAGEGGEVEDRSTFLSRVQGAWHKTVGNYATSEEHSRNLFQRLVDFGNITGEEARRLVAETQGRVEQNRKELEERVEESLKRATSRLTLPSPDEIEELETKVDEIERRIAALESSPR